jgi:hypothetical protein
MSQYSILNEWEQGMLCILDARDLLERDADKGLILSRLDSGIDALQFFIGEITKGQST